MRHYFVITALLLVINSLTAHADSVLCPLTGINNICSSVGLHGPTDKAGINPTVYETKLNHRLQNDGLYNKQPDALLTFDIDTKAILSGTVYIVIVTCDLNEQTTLSRTGTKNVTVKTWAKSVAEIIDNDHVGSSISECLNLIMTEFESDYRKDNPTISTPSLPAPVSTAIPTPVSITTAQ